MDLKAVVDKIPEYTRFLTVDELDASTRETAARFPGVARTVRLGVSRGGTPLDALVIGSGSRHALLFGLPHPNEPVGAMTCEALSRILCEDEALRRALDYTWIILKAADPDGARLNENWFGGPFTIAHYAKNFYRPPGHEQIEWTFPITYKRLRFTDVLPETQAIMNAIDQFRPDLMASLHNAGFGGAYWYLSRPIPSLYGALHAAAARQRVPLALGEPEVPYAVRYHDAVYKTLGSRETYDYIEANGQDPMATRSSGTSSADYAEAQGHPTTSLVSEVPYFYDPRISDTSPSKTRRRDAIVSSAAEDTRYVDAVEAVLKDTPRDLPDSPFRRAVETFMPQIRLGAEAERRWAETGIDPDAMATVAEAFEASAVRPFYRLLMIGMLVRMYAGAGPVEDAARALFASELGRVETRFPAYEVVPIRNLVGVQLESVMATATRIQFGD